MYYVLLYCCTAVQEILRITSHNWQQFDVVNVATALHQLGSCRLTPSTQAAIVARPEFMQLRALTGGSWSIVCCQVKSGGGLQYRMCGVETLLLQAMRERWLLGAG
jgi:hypothetical protein